MHNYLLQRWNTIKRHTLDNPISDSATHLLQATIARPLPLFWASVVALGGSLALELISRDNALQLSGSEVWWLFIGGWLLGLVSELVLLLKK